MSTKRFLAVVLLWSCLCLSGGVVPWQASAAVSEQPSLQGDDEHPSLSSDTDMQPNIAPDETNQSQPLGVFPDTDTEHNQKLCESPQVVVARCQPVPGSPLSASPLV